MNAVIAAQTTDPEQETLGDMLRAFREAFGGSSVSSAEIIRRLNNFENQSGPERDLREAFNEFSPRATESAKSLGRVLKYRVGRIVGGLRLEKVQDKHTNTSRWRVVEVE